MNIDLQAPEITPLRNTFARVAAYHGDKVASRYQEVTLGVQPTANFHYRPTWEPEFELFDTGRTAVKLADWYVLRDPRQYYYANWTMARARQQEAMEANYQFVESRGLIDKMPDATGRFTNEVMIPNSWHCSADCKPHLLTPKPDSRTRGTCQQRDRCGETHATDPHAGQSRGPIAIIDRAEVANLSRSRSRSNRL